MSGKCEHADVILLVEYGVSESGWLYYKVHCKSCNKDVLTRKKVASGKRRDSG